jgi:signal transduction histidine kinase
VKRRVLVTYLLLTLLVLVSLEVPLALSFRDRQIAQVETGLERDAFVLAAYVEDALNGTASLDLQAVVTNYSEETDGRAVIVDANGEVLADSDPAIDGQRNFSTRPEIAAALDMQVSTGTRYSTTLGTGLVYVAVPVTSGQTVHGAVRLTYSTDQVDARVYRYWLLLLGAGLVTLAAATAIGILLARWVTRPLAMLQTAATRIGNGDLDTRADPSDGPPEVRQLATAFNTTAVRLQTLVTAQEQFVADASHQLRTPLTALRLRLEMLELDLDEGGSEDIAAALSEVQRLSRLVDGLLSLARAERSPAIRPEPIALDAPLADRCATWDPVAAERLVTIAAAPTELRGHISEDTLDQVLDNLIANALEVSPPGSTVDLFAATETVDSARFVAIHVVDCGPGMTDEQRAKAFDRFWRAGTTRSDLGGSGLGLAIVQKLLIAEGARIELRAASTGGLDAVILLPVQA